MQFHRLDSHLNRFFATFITLLAEVFYLVVCISWSFHGCLICCLRQPWKYYENTNGEKMRTLLAGYTFIGFALLYFPPLTSCPLRGLFSIGPETKQLSCFHLSLLYFCCFISFLQKQLRVVLDCLFFFYFYYFYFFPPYCLG